MSVRTTPLAAASAITQSPIDNDSPGYHVNMPPGKSPNPACPPISQALSKVLQLCAEHHVSHCVMTGASYDDIPCNIDMR